MGTELEVGGVSVNVNDYILHPSKPHYWVNLHKGKLQTLGLDSKVILDNPTLGSKYIIPFDEISNLFNLSDSSIDFWRMWLASRSSQPHVFTIIPCQWLPGNKVLTKESREFFDASKFYVPSVEDQRVGQYTEGLAKTETPSESTETEGQALGQFEMEDELEGFIYANWDSIPLFSMLEKFNLPQSHPGRQVPTDIGTIDFLAKDRSSGQFVVMELKRDRSSDDVVGQVLRYMGWVAKKLANGNQEQVRGVIICQKQDERLKYAVSCLGGLVTVFEYQVRFLLSPANTI
jgi:hypothetical protein